MALLLGLGCGSSEDPAGDEATLGASTGSQTTTSTVSPPGSDSATATPSAPAAPTQSAEPTTSASANPSTPSQATGSESEPPVDPPAGTPTASQSTDPPTMGAGGQPSEPTDPSSAGGGGGAGNVNEPEPEPEPGSDCGNGMMDGDEAGIDCGGSCPACVQYELSQPNPENENRSACEPNGNGFMCPRAMAFSDEMLQAALDDWGGPEAPFVYGVVGHDPDPGGVDGPSANYSSTCCQCYQLVFKGPTDASVSVPIPKPMIVQAFNTHAGGPTAFDVYMAVGGHGNFNGCTENGRLYSGYPDTDGYWNGGVRATRYDECRGDAGYDQASLGSDACQSFIEGECNQIMASEAVQSTARQSCIEGNRVNQHYHMNWDVVVQRVECPEALTRVTGCALNGQDLPQADPAITNPSDALANGFRDGYHTTTMEDCCRPTCAWPTQVTNTRDGWSRFYVCDAAGNAD